MRQSKIKISKANESCAPDMDIRRLISEPYNFQHLTHTHANQFQTLQNNSHSELATEFSAIRASQTPRRHLQGIKAKNLQRRNPSEASSESSSPILSRHVSISQSSPRTPEREQFNGSQVSAGSLQCPRSVENFSQPSPKTYKPRPSPITPPPRMSSKKPGSEILPVRDIYHDSPSLHGYPASVETANSDPFPLTRVSTTYASVDWEDDLFDYSTAPHAVSTPDMTAFTLKPLPFGNMDKDLPNLPEEVEPSPPGEKSPRPSLSPSRPRLSLHPAKSFPSTKTSSRRWSRTSSRVSPDGLVSPLLDGPPLAEAVLPSIDQPFDDIPFGPRLSRPISSHFARLDESWEDDIDYCYEHAAEADCDFDWDRISSEDEKTAVPSNDADPEVDRSPFALEHSKEDCSTNSCASDPKSDRPVPYYLPPLQLSSTESSFSSRESSKSSTLSTNGPVTPSRSLLLPQPNLPFRTAKDMTNSVFIPRDFESQFTQDELYQKFLAGDHAPEQVYPFHHINFDTIPSNDNSPRSSHSPISKYASKESFEQAQSSLVCHHRDNESVGSVPELVHSRLNSQSSNLAINRLDRLANVSIQPDKPLPPRPTLGDSNTQDATGSLMVLQGIIYNQRATGPENTTLVTPSSSDLPKIPRDRVLSDAALRVLDEFPNPAGSASIVPRRIRSSNSVSVKPSQALSITQVSSSVNLPIPF